MCMNISTEKPGSFLPLVISNGDMFGIFSAYSFKCTCIISLNIIHINGNFDMGLKMNQPFAPLRSNFSCSRIGESLLGLFSISPFP